MPVPVAFDAIQQVPLGVPVGGGVDGTPQRICGVAPGRLDQVQASPPGSLTARDLAGALDSYAQAEEVVWVQEEPANMGGLFNMLPRLERIAGERHVLSVKRSASASPATGSAKAHEVEQKTLLTLAFTAKG